ncbi:GNAT family N-acetyltransferase [Streptomyces sp. NBC_01387]|uniref:GNAT family N-acetyltransferase n=1 Tax=unclassified Streptomyces TaxID=2593676 RepID=UPI0020254EFD|nr:MULTISPECIES: GNAT family N-acetyltransferase [unclassified Streptomyces]MCX4551186.1 GNAT family N-acetyltransferase [Streptomyces sp. NBC_01500]WSC22585.1 GNAT family N-acetyltransferase [Streptomyces sp. NBC_01766]WSV56428.1 GNAT family N-acetyltransferase [Streptomyces sp. NBC_01014]
MPSDTRSTLDALEQYYDTVPRSGARTEDFGPLTLFVREGAGWPFYARPTRLWSGAATTAADVDRVRARQREVGAPEAFEWVAETTPLLRKAVEESGLEVHEHPLMVLDPSAPTRAPHPSVRVLDAADPLLSAALAVPQLAFAAPGTAVGDAGPAELAREIAARLGDGRVENTAARIRTGRTTVAAALGDGSVLCSGMHNPVDEVTEIVAVGTLPSARRQGLGLAVTAALAADARARGVGTVFLSAGDEDVARMYGRLGFCRVATALIAE